MKICQVFIYYLFNAIGQEQRKEFLNFYLMKTKMKICQVRHSKTVLCHKQKDNSFSTTVPLLSFSPSNSQTHDQIFAAQFHSVHHHDYQPKHKRP